MGSLEEYASQNNIPIIQKEGLKFLTNYIKKNNVQSILEIGTAIGYSAINMALISKNIKVTSAERNDEMFKEATLNVKKFGLEKQINLIFGDALDIDINEKYDLIFIDGAKAQYIKFFEKYKNNLKPSGAIITDNLNFHGLTSHPEEIKSKNLKALVIKINRYKEFLINNKEFITKFYDIGDGIALSKRKGVI